MPVARSEAELGRFLGFLFTAPSRPCDIAAVLASEREPLRAEHYLAHDSWNERETRFPPESFVTIAELRQAVLGWTFGERVPPGVPTSETMHKRCTLDSDGVQFSAWSSTRRNQKARNSFRSSACPPGGRS